MATGCPLPGPDDPLVRGLIAQVDCNVQAIVRDGYASLFQPGGDFSALLTSLLTVFVALFGYQLLLGRAQLRISDLTLTAVKLGAVLALTTRWDVYQGLVYGLLFRGPEQLASLMLAGVQPETSLFPGDVFDGLQYAFDALTAYSTDYARQGGAMVSPLLGGLSFGAMALTMSASVLLLSSLGVLLASKVVLALLLAVGPIFIAMLLFESTRGLFEGWLRASLAFALAPLATTLLLVVALALLEPPLLQIAEMRERQAYTLAPVYSVLILTLVFAGVALGLIIAGATIAGGFKLPRRPQLAPSGEGAAAPANQAVVEVVQSRANRTAAAAAALDRRDSLTFAPDRAQGFAGRSYAAGRSALEPASAAGSAARDAGGGGDRRTVISAAIDRGPAVLAAEPRLGQGPRRNASPRTARAGARSAS